MKIEKETIYSGIFGLVVADALGVPVEFQDRSYLQKNPITDMIGYGTYNQPPGTWSDDSSLTFALLDSLSRGYDLTDIAKQFVRWYAGKEFTPLGEVFDIGNTTVKAMRNLMNGVSPKESGAKGDSENGNGSLMRILPLTFYIYKKKLSEKENFQKIKEVSSITHAHPYSVLSCYIYIDFCLHLLNKKTIQESHELLIAQKDKYLQTYGKPIFQIFDRIFHKDFSKLPEKEIKSDGFVIHSLEASIWCLLNTQTYSEAILRAINLGSDTDTTGAITGGPAGIAYGFHNIPKKWINSLQKKEFIYKLCDNLYNAG